MRRVLAVVIIGMMLLPVTGHAEAATKFETALVGFAMIPYLTMARLPDDTPLGRGSGFFVRPDLRRLKMIPMTYEPPSFMSAPDAPRPVRVYFPLRRQPLQGFSGVVAVGDGTFWVLQDNGYGTKANSPDYHLAWNLIRPDWKAGTVEVLKTVYMHDPNRVVPFHIVNEYTKTRYLTGMDLDPESIQKVGDHFFIGDEFGPYLIKTDLNGRVVGFWETPGADGVTLRSPDHFAMALPAVPGRVEFQVRRSRGFEGMAQSPDGRFLYLMLEGPLWDIARGEWEHRRGLWSLRILEFDVAAGRFTGRHWKYLLESNANNIGDFNMIDRDTALVIERDWGEGDPGLACRDVVHPGCFNIPARFKRVYKIDLGRPDPDGFVRKIGYLDLMEIADPDDLNRDGKRVFTFPFVTIENVTIVDADHIIVANDNNFGFSVGRKLGVNDDNEFILLRVSAFLRAR